MLLLFVHQVRWVFLFRSVQQFYQKLYFRIIAGFTMLFGIYADVMGGTNVFVITLWLCTSKKRHLDLKF